ncbi:hypothetical protein CK203_110616 [Vitis vinifera]|uniref:Uncharacterized protein n=1 Tax=Vitis vinifera TaxID=29760 RepID=A0A438CB35_VITVI|nr:hypothetical protein CK203_110616 [Vitis vinifera]
MNFMSYVAEVSRGWDEPNARDMGRMTSQPSAKAEMYILNNDIDMKVNIAAMARRLEELEMKKMQECPTIPAVREMFGDCNTYNSNWRDHPNFSWEPQPPQYQQPIQALQQASNLEQAMMNLSKCRRKNSPSQPYQNSMSIHEMEAKEGEPSQKREVKEVITLRSEKDGYDVNVEEEPQRIVIKKELMKKHMPPPFLQALYGKIIQRKSQVRDANFIWDPSKLNQDQIF